MTRAIFLWQVFSCQKIQDLVILIFAIFLLIIIYSNFLKVFLFLCIKDTSDDLSVCVLRFPPEVSTLPGLLTINIVKLEI